MSRSATIVQSIRAHLRNKGMTYRELAKALGVSEPTIKRNLGRGEFSLRRLDEICDVLDVSLVDLVQGHLPESSRLSRLTEQQERALVRDRRLLLLTYLLVNDWTFAEITSTFAFSENDLVGLLLRLDALGIVAYRPPKRVRRLTARNFSWRADGPVQTFFLERVVPEFLGARFDTVGDDLHFVGATLSPASRLRVKAAIGKLVEDFEAMARQDARLPLDARDGCSALLAFRGWELSDFTRLRRKPAASR
ncbi:MAG TPA: helix-turn-helix transcriptional regulator [Rhodanobacteraceae bacterium]